MRLIRKLLPYTTVALVIALLYLAYVFYSRWDSNHSREQAVEDAKAKADAQIVKMYGSGDLKILSFYATKGVIHRGEKTTICYGVSNASAVRIEPEIEALKPAISHCVEAGPVKDTQYTLTAEDGAGHSASEAFVVRVR